MGRTGRGSLATQGRYQLSIMRRGVLAQTNKVAISPNRSRITRASAAGLTAGFPPIRMSVWIGRRVEDLSARLTDLALLLVGTPARERLRGARLHRGIGGRGHHRSVGGFFGSNDVHDRVDQRAVGERLREVAEVPAGARLDLLCVQMKRAGQRPQPISQM